MFKNIGEIALTKIFELIEEKIIYLKGLIDGLPKVAKSGNYNDLDGKPTIPTIPSSLPANGGNADTVDGYHIVVSSSPPAQGTADNVITIVI